MIAIALWFCGFLVGFGIGGHFGKMGERKDWDLLIRKGKLPRPDQRWKPATQWKPEEYKKDRE
jgi:hypothetical protein